MQVKLSRRQLLAGTAALAALPMLRPSAARASDERPLRLIVMPLLNGVDHQYFWPGPAGSLVTEPLTGYMDRLTFVRGLDIDGSHDHMAVRSMFTGAPIASYESPDPVVPSIDQVVASHFQATAPTARRSIHLGALPASSLELYQLYGRSTFFFDPAPLDYDANPVTAFDRLFGELGGKPSPPPPTGPEPLDLRDRSREILAQELAELRARAEGSSQIDKLAQHQAALEGMGSGDTPNPTAPASCSDATIASVEALRPELSGNEAGAYRHDLYEPIFDAQIDILARAVVCGMTRVATLQANSADGNALVPVLGGRPHHDTSHGSQPEFALCQQWYASKLARLLAALDVDDPLDPGHTVLDNSCVLWMAECNPNHASNDIVALYAGGLGGRLVTGTTVDVPGATNRHLLRTLCDAAGVSGSDSGHFGEMAISEVRA